MAERFRLIALDWGTSNLRGYLIDESGQVLEQTDSNQGILNIHDQGFERVLQEFTATWRLQHPSAPIICAGMITSKQGWVETDYITCPIDVTAIANALQCHELDTGGKVYFVAGLSYDPRGGWPDVMRGEEVQILGAATYAPSSQVLILPGTHSKWVHMSGTTINSFQTFMTGELYATLKQHSILGSLMRDSEFDPDAFSVGVRHMTDAVAPATLSALFSARSLALFGRLPPENIESYLSGLLIGGEIAEGRGLITPEKHEVVIIGGDKLSELYQNAFSIAGVSTRREESDVAAQGLFQIAQSAGLIG